MSPVYGGTSSRTKKIYPYSWRRLPFPWNYPYLVAQVEVIKPRFICALDRHATQTLLKTEEGINRLRRRFHDYHEVKIIPTYHPAYLLRSPDGNDKAKDDLRKLRALLDESS
ncbi:MAG: hypothetical protein NTZ78_14935 [Candidatus Aureabacteria bacterium]|nr:hypothetical protein [Candidatus Auribacterota bacterium]